MKPLLLPLVALLVLPACSRDPKISDQVRPAADPATANATSFTTTLTEVYFDKQGVIATGSIRTNAPLATATGGTYSLRPQPTGVVSYPGQAVVDQLREKSDGHIRIRHSGDQAFLQLFTPDGQPFLRIIGPPHGNAIQSNWYHEGTNSGTASLRPQ